MAGGGGGGVFAVQGPGDVLPGGDGDTADVAEDHPGIVIVHAVQGRDEVLQVQGRLWHPQQHQLKHTVIHVDPKFSRTSARCDFHVPLRSGTDIAFLGGMVKYILEKNLIQPDQQLSEHDLALLIFEAGFSTADNLTQLSGRGIGMDMVKEDIQQLQGHISVDTKAGKMTKFTLRIPKNVAKATEK